MRTRMNWKNEYRINIIADIITRDRFFELRTHFHIINNEEDPPTNKDKCIKVRLLYNY